TVHTVANETGAGAKTNTADITGSGTANGNDHTLPQTGETDAAGALALAGVALMGALALMGAKRRHEN
ncbi:putative cell surface protein, partial [Lacticaseibacillus paracasei subsp. paracasei Lpp227]